MNRSVPAEIVRRNALWPAKHSASANISGFNIGNNGALTPIGSTVVGSNPPGATNLEIAISSDVKFLYSLNSGNGTVGIFGIPKDGTLVPLGSFDGIETKSRLQRHRCKLEISFYLRGSCSPSIRSCECPLSFVQPRNKSLWSAQPLRAPRRIFAGRWTHFRRALRRWCEPHNPALRLPCFGQPGTARGSGETVRVRHARRPHPHSRRRRNHFVRRVRPRNQFRETLRLFVALAARSLPRPAPVCAVFAAIHGEYRHPLERLEDSYLKSIFRCH